jgi:ankyrin repeat protein
MNFNATQTEDILFDYARKGNPESIRQRISEGADINIRDRRGMTALDLAYQQGNEEAIPLLQ